MFQVVKGNFSDRESKVFLCCLVMDKVHIYVRSNAKNKPAAMGRGSTDILSDRRCIANIHGVSVARTLF